MLTQQEEAGWGGMGGWAEGQERVAGAAATEAAPAEAVRGAAAAERGEGAAGEAAAAAGVAGEERAAAAAETADQAAAATQGWAAAADWALTGEDAGVGVPLPLPPLLQSAGGQAGGGRFNSASRPMYQHATCEIKTAAGIASCCKLSLSPAHLVIKRALRPLQLRMRRDNVRWDASALAAPAHCGGRHTFQHALEHHLGALHCSVGRRQRRGHGAGRRGSAGKGRVGGGSSGVGRQRTQLKRASIRLQCG